METGPLYEQAVQRMRDYRSVAARIDNARNSTAGKLDRRLEKLGELIGETLQQLTDAERMALSCWRDGVVPDTYEVDHEELVSKPYISIRKINRWTEEYDADAMKASWNDEVAPESTRKENVSDKLRAFLSIKDDY